MSKRWILWAAVSSLPQAKKISNEDQITLGHEHLTRHGGTLIAEIVVPGKSRSITMLETARSEIEQYEELYQRIIKREFDVLGYLDRSRLGRKASLSMTVVGLCHDYGIVTYEYENPPNSLVVDETHDGLLMGAIKSVGGEHEITKMKERRVKGMAGRIRDGKFPYVPPYGYLRDPMSADYKIIIHPVEAEAIQRIIELYLAGRGRPFIAEEMERLGYPTRGGEWDGAVIQNIIATCERYAGAVSYNTKDPRFGIVRGVGKHPHILTPELVAAVKSETRSRTQNRKVASEQCTVLSSICYCAVCGQRLVCRSDRGGFIVCQGSHEGKRYMRYASILEEFKQTIAGLSLPSAEELGLVDDQNKARLEAILRGIDINIQSAEKSKSRASTAFVDGVMDATDYQNQVKRLRERVAQLELEKADTLAELANEEYRKDRVKRIEEFRANALARLEGEDIRAINAWLRNSVKIFVRDGHIESVDIL